MENAKKPKISPYLRVLALGPAGAGKTTLERSLPGKKFAYYFDPNVLASVAGADIDYEHFSPDLRDIDMSVKTLKKDVADKPFREKIEPLTYRDWEKDFDEKYDEDFFASYDWLIFDSFTMFADAIMDRVLHLNNRLGKQPEQADWAAQIMTIRNVFRVLTNMSLNVYCTGHTEIRKDDASGKTYGQIMMTGRLRVLLPLLFTDIWRCHCDSDAEAEAFTLQTRPDRENPTIRTSIKPLEMWEDVTIQDFAKPLEGGLAPILKKSVFKQKGK